MLYTVNTNTTDVHCALEPFPRSICPTTTCNWLSRCSALCANLNLATAAHSSVQHPMKLITAISKLRHRTSPTDSTVLWLSVAAHLGRANVEGARHTTTEIEAQLLLPTPNVYELRIKLRIVRRMTSARHIWVLFTSRSAAPTKAAPHAAQNAMRT